MADDGNGRSPEGDGSDRGPAATPPAGEAAGRAPDEVAAIRADLDAAKEKLLRAYADLENYKKRAAREKQEALRLGNEGLLRDLLPVIDNLERAHAHARGVAGAEAIAEGITLVHRGLLETLERHGVRPVEARGTAFDPKLHEAIGHVESEHPANTVVDEHQRGYALHDRLLRPALVTVGKGRQGGVETSEDDG
jgi:molecular chaperone GrpE